MKAQSKRAAFRFKPFSRRQLQLLNWWRDGSPVSDKFICLADGAIRSGKTTAMIASFLQFTQSRFTGQDFILAGRSIGVLKRNLVNPMLLMLNAWDWPYEFNRSDYVITVGTNAYYLFGANNEKSQDVIQGMTAAGALLDEAALMPQSFVEQVLARCSVDGAKVFMNCNPNGPYHYLKTDFIDRAAEMGVVHLHFGMDDNLTLSAATKARYHRTFKGVFYQRFILGRWVQAEGLIYDMFSDACIVDHVPESFLREAQRYIVCDYGTTNPCVFLDILYDGTTALILHEYYFDSRAERYQKTDQQYVNDMDSSMLIKSGILFTVLGSGEVIYNTPYARRWYYNQPLTDSLGRHYEGGDSTRFQGAPMRGAYWFERMKNTGGKEAILAGAKKLAGRTK